MSTFTCNFARIVVVLTAGLLGTSAALAQDASKDTAPATNSSYIDADGTAHVTRIVPVPDTVSSQAQKMLSRRVSDANKPESLEERRRKTDVWQNGAGKRFQDLYPVAVEKQIVGGVHTRIITPPNIPEANRDRILINLHGGGFNSDSGSLTETIPVAAMTKTKAIAVLYRLAPENPFPAGAEDAIAVYKEVLKTYKPERIAIFGTSAGAVLTGEVAVKLRRLGLPLPGALGIFSGFGDFSRQGDSRAIYALNGFAGYLPTPTKNGSGDKSYVGNTDLNDPVLSPIFADVHGFPPTLFITSTRDLLLSGTTIMHRAFLRSGVNAQLVVFEALPHAFWNDPNLPESKEAHEIMSKFFDTQLTKSSTQMP